MIILLGTKISIPPFSPGHAWLIFHYLKGLENLGHDVYLLEEVEPDWCVDCDGRSIDFERSVNRKVFQRTMEEFGLIERSWQIYTDNVAKSVPSKNNLFKLLRKADVLINWSGHLKKEFILTNVRKRIYFDLDPVFTQLWYSQYGADLNFKMHDVFLTVGLNIGTANSHIPDCGVSWHHVLPPVILDYWPFHCDIFCKRYTTIATLKPFGELRFQGEWYGSKYEELRKYKDLPRFVNADLEIALKYYREEVEHLNFLTENGWYIRDADELAGMTSYQSYIAKSRGEIGLAQNAYIKGSSGWFSDRWTHYLASGKPVLAQSTGFEHHVPTGNGLLSFQSLDEAIDAINRINNDYHFHCKAAREFAQEFLDYRKVLPKMLDECMAS